MGDSNRFVSLQSRVDAADWRAVFEIDKLLKGAGNIRARNENRADQPRKRPLT